MADENDTEERYPFYVDRAKSGRASCKRCRQTIAKGELRLSKAVANPYGSGIMKNWHHIDCMFEAFAKQRATTAKIESVDDVGGWYDLSEEDQETILDRLPDSVRETNKKQSPKAKQEPEEKRKKPKKNKVTADDSGEVNQNNQSDNQKDKNKDDSLKQFIKLCQNIRDTPGYLDKTAIVKKFITEGSDKVSYKGELLLLIKLLLPGVIKRIYNLQSKQIIKIFSRLFGTNQDDMLESLEQGDVAETISEYFEKSNKFQAANKSTLSIQNVDNFLEYLSKLTKEEDQINHFGTIVPKCTSEDLKIIIRLIKHDLRINAGAKHILDAVHKDAYEAFQASRDINSIIEKFGDNKMVNKLNTSVNIAVLVPVLPMLAQACKSTEEAFKKFSNGMYSEIKYDGERVQIHKNGNTFKYYSRSLKPVMAHKVKHLEEFIPKAFPHGKNLILDSEILMIDTTTGDPLPFGTLGIHKKTEYQDANVCLFVFDCIYYNGETLFNRPLKERKEILQENMKEIKNRILFSEMKLIKKKEELNSMMTEVFKKGLEGLVLKDIMGSYEPGKRHWLKVKRDYLFDGRMADSADLVVLGAWYGTGQKGGMMSVFLMGCYDNRRSTWCTVTKVHTGHDDQTLEKLQTELEMEKIGKDQTKVPNWLKCNKTMIPDFVAKDPKKQPVWEITGAEFTKNVVHTADGISIRFPRVTRIRDDKDWSQATTLEELQELYTESKKTANFELDADAGSSTNSDVSPPTSPKKRKNSPIKRPNVTPKKQNITPQKRPATTSFFSDSTSPAKKTKYTIKNPLPDLFVGMKIILPKFISEEEKPKFEQYFIAYGGEILDKSLKNTCTHKIVKDGKNKDKDCITLDQLWTCIRKKKPISNFWMTILD